MILRKGTLALWKCGGGYLFTMNAVVALAKAEFWLSWMLTICRASLGWVIETSPGISSFASTSRDPPCTCQHKYWPGCAAMPELNLNLHVVQRHLVGRLLGLWNLHPRLLQISRWWQSRPSTACTQTCPTKGT